MLPRPASGKFSLVITPAGEKLVARRLRSHADSGLRDLMRAFHLIRLELKQQVFGLTLGHLWLLLEPALQAGAYYFLLTVVFGMRGADATFAFFFVAIVFWRSHAMLTTSSTSFLTSRGIQYIDQGFGLNIAFLEFAAQELALFAIRFVVLLAFLVVAGYEARVSWLAGLFFGACMFSFSLALAVWLAVVGAMLKDIGKFVGHFVWLWWYLSPGLYSFGRVPDWAQPVFALNPFTYILPAAHAAMLGPVLSATHFLHNMVLAGISLAVLLLGWRVMKHFGYGLARYV